MFLCDWFGSVLGGGWILTETRKQNVTNKRKYKVHHLYRSVTVASCHLRGDKLTIVKPTRIDTAGESGLASTRGSSSPSF